MENTFTPENLLSNLIQNYSSLEDNNTKAQEIYNLIIEKYNNHK